MRELPRKPPAKTSRVQSPTGSHQVSEWKFWDLVKVIEDQGWVRMKEGAEGSHFRWQRKGTSAGMAFEPTISGGKLKDIAIRFGVERLVLQPDRQRVARVRGERSTHRKSGKPLAPPAPAPDLSRPKGQDFEQVGAPGDQPFFARVVPLHAAGRIALLDQSPDATCVRCAGAGVVTCPACLAETKDVVITILQACLQEIAYLRAAVRERDQRLAVATTGVVDERTRRLYEKLKVLVE